MNDALRHTPLSAWHRTAGAVMAGFAGYVMPLWYPAGARDEHLAVLTGAGLFDTSHMAVVEVAGPGAFRLLQACFSRDLERSGPDGGPLPGGRALYGVFLDERGHLLDDALLLREGEERFFAVVNAGMGPEVTHHLVKHASGLEAAVSDHTDRLVKLDLQGPEAARIASRVLADPETALRDLRYFAFRGSLRGSAVRLRDGTPVLLSRSGYTGEFGFEMFFVPEGEDHAARVWEMFLSAGHEYGCLPCGLAARDSLRAGAALPLARQDIGDFPFIRNPWAFALPWKRGHQSFTKDFFGAGALLSDREPWTTYPFTGFDPRKVETHGEGARVMRGGRETGLVTTCATDMGMGRNGSGRVLSVASPEKPEGFAPRGLACGFVRVREPLALGARVKLRDARREIEVEITEDIRPHRTARRPVAAMLSGARTPPPSGGDPA